MDSFSYRKHNKTLTDAARKLRKEMTPQEHKLWYGFCRHYPIPMLRQKVIGKSIVDFYCAQAHLAIELDGSQHEIEQGKGSDMERTQILNAYGIEVMRFTNQEVDTLFPDVCRKIDEVIQSRKDGP